ncbi:membrane protein [Asanoa siamensis]|uniref:Membrane protein n=1 Tax=Asanoa siamensis TaxID=926357 RepID=A0ABQ4CP34_9ACTN|nr:membrane protein [Asanoa siamensis]
MVPLRQAIMTGIGPLLLALIVGVGFIAAFVIALHDPKPDDVPVAVVRGDQPAEALLAAVRGQGRQLEAIAFDDAAAADRALRRQDVYAVLATSTTGAGLTLTTASAAGPAATAVITGFVTVAARRAGTPLAVVDAVPVDPDDPRGVVPFYLALGLVIGGYFGGISLSLALGTVPRNLPRAALRIGGLALHAVLLSLGGTLIVGPGADIWHQNLAGLFGAGALLAFTAALFASAVQAWLARVGTTLIILVVVVLGNPGSGGIYPAEFLPGFFRGIHDWDLPGLGSDLVRSVVYFPAGTAGWPAGKLAIWCVGSVVLLLGAMLVLGRPVRSPGGWRRAH